jgi:predicted MFS family arabinose efflux permease
VVNREKKIKIAIVAVSLVTALGNSASVILSRLQEDFPEVSVTGIQSFISLQQLTIMVFTLLSGVLTVFFSKKILLVMGLLFVAAFGTLPVILNDYYCILLTRLGFGAGLGLVTPLCLALISENFLGEERIALSGIQFASYNIGQAFTSVSAGKLVEVNWRYVCVLCLLALAVLFCILYCLPGKGLRGDRVSSSSWEKNLKKREEENAGTIQLNLPVAIVALVTVAYNTPFVALYSYLSLILSQESIGSSEIMGNGLGFLSVAGMITGILFGRIFHKIRYASGAAAMAVVCIGYIVLSKTTSPWGIYLALFIMGAGNAVVMSFFHYHLILFAPPRATAFCTAFSNVLNSLGSFLVPYLFGAYLSAIHSIHYRDVFIFAACVMAALTMLLVCYACWGRRIRVLANREEAASAE